MTLTLTVPRWACYQTDERALLRQRCDAICDEIEEQLLAGDRRLSARTARRLLDLLEVYEMEVVEGASTPLNDADTRRRLRTALQADVVDVAPAEAQDLVFMLLEIGFSTRLIAFGLRLEEIDAETAAA